MGQGEIRSAIPPGVMRLNEISPNPHGNIDRLFALQGDPTQGPITRIDGGENLPEVSGQGKLRVFHFNDLHNHLTDLSGPTKGTRRFSQMVQRVRHARAKANPTDATLFLSIGDDHTGTMLDELIGWKDDDFVLDPSYRAYSAAGLDVSVLGNHEFDRGTSLLARGIRQDARFPLFSANVHSSQNLNPGQDYFPGAIAIVGGLRVGLIGLTTHVETRVGQASDPTLEVASPVKTLCNMLGPLTGLVDVVLVLSHCGYGDGAHQSGKAAAARDIGEADFSLAQNAARRCNKPVLLIGAHTHTPLNEAGLEACNILDGVPIFQSGCNGRFLGEIELSLDSGGFGDIVIPTARLHPIKPFRDSVGPDHPDAAEHEQPQDFDQEFESKTIEPILAQVADALKTPIAPVTTKRLGYADAVLARYAHEGELLNFVCDSTVLRLKTLGHEVDFALMNGATIQSGVEVGTLTAGDWFDVMPYADEIFIVKVSGAELDAILQSNAKRILRRDEIAKTNYSGFLARGFFHTSAQVRYRIEPGATARHAKATDIRIDGTPLEKLRNHRFNVVMSTYLALGGFGERWNGKPISGGVPGDLPGYDLRGFPARNTNLVFRDEVANQIRARGVLDDTNVAPRDGRLLVKEKEKVENDHGG